MCTATSLVESATEVLVRRALRPLAVRCTLALALAVYCVSAWAVPFKN